MRKPTYYLIVLILHLFLHGCYAISDPDIWPNEFIQKGLLPDYIGKSEAEVLRAFGSPKFVVSNEDSTLYVYENIDDDSIIPMVLIIPFPILTKGYEVSCVLLIFDGNSILQRYEIESRGALSYIQRERIGSKTGEPSKLPSGCRAIFSITKDEHFMNWCLYESLMHNSDIKAFEVVEEYRQYTLRSVEDPAAIQWLCRAADHGYYHAQSEVGRHYWKGLNGVQKDLPRAYAWYKLAGQSMCRDYSIQLKEILNDMSAEQSSEASFLLDKWVTGQCNKDLIHGMQMEN